METTCEIGARAEEEAAAWLCERGLRVVERNFRTRVGEIDLIVEDDSELVFVEVRVRRAGSWVDGLESVDWRKRRKLTNTAKLFLAYRYGGRARGIRFDILAWDGKRWDWYRDAWRA
jgi:putative endonuclease